MASRSPDDEEESGDGNRMLTILLVIAAMIAVVYLVFDHDKGTTSDRPATFVTSPDDVEAQEHRARTWAIEKLGTQLSGVSCDGFGRCTLMPKSGAPFLADCREPTCVLTTSERR